MTKLAFPGNSAQCTPRALSHMLRALDFTTLHQNALYLTTLHNNPLYFTIQHQSAGQGNKVLLLLLLLLVLLVHKACCLSCTREAVFNGADHHCHIALAVKQRNSQQSFFNLFQWGLPSSLCDHGNCQIDSFGINMCFPCYSNSDEK